MSRRRINNDNDSGWWIYPALVLGVLFIIGSAEDDAGAFMCPRSSHYCSGVYQ